jgi:hypothetical protein
MTGHEKIADHLETAVKFKRLAAEEPNPKLKADFERQALAYRRLDPASAR